MGEVRSYPVPVDGNPFEALAAVRFEAVGKGRERAVLTKVDEAGGVPVVRTTTNYSTPTQQFRPVHELLARQVQDVASLPVGFNNALVEVYTDLYATMAAHSDQALDLADGSFVAVFSCYERPEGERPSRKLVVEAKEAGGGTAEIPLAHNGVVVFSVDANRRLRHKIVRDPSGGRPGNRWLGVTFRTSKTYVRYRDGRAYFEDGTELTLADDGQRREFYGLRRRENTETGFTYPRITYTISESDLLPPEPAEAAGGPSGR